MKNIAIILIVLWPFCYSGFLYGQQISDTLHAHDILSMSLEELLKVKVNVSTTIPTELFESPSTVTVIDREMIEKYNFLTIDEAVRNVAGVEILQTVIDENVPTVRGILQNFYANKVLVMINNIPVWHPTYGNTTLNRMSITDVERIEVLKGPASVLYGTNAFNGVINIIRKDPDKSEVSAKIVGGLPDNSGAEVNYTQQKGKLKLNISASGHHEIRSPYLTKGGFSPELVEEVVCAHGDTQNVYLYEADTLYYFTKQIRYSNFNFGLKYKNSEFYVNTFQNSYSHPGTGSTYRTGANRSVTDKGTLASYSYKNQINDKTYLLINAHFDYHYRNQYQTLTTPMVARLSSYRTFASAKLNYSLLNNLKLEVGTDAFTGQNIGHEIIMVSADTVVNVNIPYDTEINEISLFSQLNWQFKKLYVLGGIRYTYNQAYNTNISPRLTASFNINNSNNIKVTYGQSYRTANLLESYFNHWSVVGNPNLEPEKNETFEVLYLTRLNHFFGQLTFFNSKYTNLIQRIRTSTDETVPAQYQNVSDLEGYGIELETKYHNPDYLNIFVNYNMLIGKKDESNLNYRYVPEHTLSAGINKPINNFFISSNAYAYSQVEGNVELIEPQFMLDAHIGFKHKTPKGIKLIHTLSFKNITDSDMLIPEYIRNRPGVNSLATTGYGRRIVYSLNLKF